MRQVNLILLKESLPVRRESNRYWFDWKALDDVLKEFYLPAVRELLNRECLLQTYMKLEASRPDRKCVIPIFYGPKPKGLMYDILETLRWFKNLFKIGGKK